ncbi:MAG: hypothetical protein ACI9O5_003409, partial [Algoriphagus sp.]
LKNLTNSGLIEQINLEEKTMPSIFSSSNQG